MDDQDHHPCSDFVAHHRKKDQGCGHEMVKHPFVIFSVIFLNDHQLKYREDVDSELEAEINFEFSPLIRWPIWVFHVDMGASPRSSN